MKTLVIEDKIFKTTKEYPIIELTKEYVIYKTKDIFNREVIAKTYLKYVKDYFVNDNGIKHPIT